MTITIKLLAGFLLISGLAFAALPTTCGAASGVVMTKNSVLLHCDSDWPSKPQFLELWRVPADWNKDPRQRGTQLSVSATITDAVPADPAYQMITFSQDLVAGVAYYLVLRLPSALPTEGPVTVLLSTANEAVIERDKIKDHWGEVFIVRSPVALSPDRSPMSGRKFFEVNNGETPVPHDACITILYEEHQTGAPCAVQPADPRRLANAGLARVALLDGKLTQAKVGAKVEGLFNLFGEAVKAQTKPDKPIELAAAPATKDAASWFLKLGYQKVTGSPYSLSIDLKVNPVLTHFGPVDLQPNIIVDIAQNEPASANPRSSDTIKVGGNLYYLHMSDPTKKPLIAGFDIKPGGGLETDREGSKKNVLGNAESQIYFRGLYHTTEMQTQRRAALKNVGTNQVAQATFGYAIGVYFGFEAGASVVEQTFKNKAKTQSIKVPTYNIARFWPRLHQTYELSRFTLDIDGTLKYLHDPEMVGHENNDGSVEVRAVKGWRFYTEPSVSVALDRGKHANFVVTFKYGAKAPNWTKTDTIVTGFAFSY